MYELSADGAEGRGLGLAFGDEPIEQRANRILGMLDADGCFSGIPVYVADEAVAVACEVQLPSPDSRRVAPRIDPEISLQGVGGSEAADVADDDRHSGGRDRSQAGNRIDELCLVVVEGRIRLLDPTQHALLLGQQPLEFRLPSPLYHRRVRSDVMVQEGDLLPQGRDRHSEALVFAQPEGQTPPVARSGARTSGFRPISGHDWSTTGRRSIL